MWTQDIFFSKHLEKGEKILFAVHRHWVLLAKPAFAAGFFGFLIPWTLYAIGFNQPAFFVIAVSWSAITYIIFMCKAFKWYANAILVTSMGVLRVDWKGFFNNVASRVMYEDVEGATYEIAGLWPTFLRYGTFKANLSSGNQFVIDYASQPAKAELMLMKLQEAYLHEKNMKDVRGLKTLLSDLATYHLKHKE